MTPIMLKTDLEVVWIKAEAMSRKGKRVLFRGNGDEVKAAFESVYKYIARRARGH